jgi:hypothetical protein
MTDILQVVNVTNFNEAAHKWLLTPDPITDEVMQCRCILLEPRTMEHLDGGLHFHWLNKVLQVSSETTPGGILLILVRESAHNKKLISRVKQLLKEEKTVSSFTLCKLTIKNLKVHSVLDIIDQNPKSNELTRTKQFSFSYCKALLWVITRKNDEVRLL